MQILIDLHLTSEIDSIKNLKDSEIERAIQRRSKKRDENSFVQFIKPLEISCGHSGATIQFHVYPFHFDPNEWQ